MSGITQIYDRQPTVPERQRPAPGFKDLPPLAVRSPVADDVDVGLIRGKAKRRKYAAHDLCLCLYQRGQCRNKIVALCFPTQFPRCDQRVLLETINCLPRELVDGRSDKLGSNLGEG